MKALLSLLIFLTTTSQAGLLNLELSKKSCKPIVVAVIDTGTGLNGSVNDSHLCNFGHKDFSLDQSYSTIGNGSRIPMDWNGHGTNVTGLIEQYAASGNLDYCIVVIKFFTMIQTGEENQIATLKAIKYATDIGANIINYSAGGYVANQFEATAVKRFLNKGGIFVAAAGNENVNIDNENTHYYPAMDDNRIIVVGNIEIDGKKAYTSNYGERVNVWEIGQKQKAYGTTLSGTSQATAVHTGKILSEMSNRCNLDN